jgi:hypothetical protein
VTLGDFGDFYCTSRHSKDPTRSRDLQTEIDSCNAALDQLDTLGAAEKYFVAGNHEDNLSRYLMSNAPELYGIVKVERLFRLRERQWRYVPYKHYVKLGRIYVTHDTGLAGATAHTRSASKFGSNLVIGHTHRVAISYNTTVTGKSHVAAMFGWGGDPTKAEYMYKANMTDWCLGFGVGTVDPAGNVHLQACPVIDYSVVVDGKLYK